MKTMEKIQELITWKALRFYKGDFFVVYKTASYVNKSWIMESSQLLKQLH
jgi:hypothetical protein